MDKLNKIDILAFVSFLTLLTMVFLFAVAMGANPTITIFVIASAAIVAMCLLFLLAALLE